MADEKKEEKSKSLLDLLLSDTSTSIQVVENQLRMIKKFKNNLTRLMLVGNMKAVEQTLADYFVVSEALMSSMLVNLNNQEKVIDAHKKKFDSIVRHPIAELKKNIAKIERLKVGDDKNNG